jgi:23S rRNA (uridine2552-2'-O)-methyltransferase
VTYQRKDAHYRRAKAQGFRARSAYKLAELDDRYRLLRKGDRVVDLGAWPGGWLQVALERVGPGGRLVGVDLVPIEPIPAHNVELVAGDIGDPIVGERIRALLGGLADVVLSDVAPKLTGIRDVDDARCAEALAAVTSALPALLRPGGRALVKIFMDPAYRENVARLRASFEEVTTTRPDASRRGSAELYVIARGFRGTPPAVDNL